MSSDREKEGKREREAVNRYGGFHLRICKTLTQIQVRLRGIAHERTTVCTYNNNAYVCLGFLSLMVKQI